MAEFRLSASVRLTAGANAALNANFGAAAATISWSGPSTATVGSPSSSFTVTVSSAVPSLVITPSAGLGGGTFTPATLTGSGTFTYTPSGVGSKTITLSNNQGLTVSPSSIALVASDPAPVVVGAYRPSQPQLFQPYYALARPSPIGQAPYYSFKAFGPNYWNIDATSGWSWTNPGGDWIDATADASGVPGSAGIPQGTVAFAQFTANAVSGSAVAHTYSGIDVTAMFRHVQGNNKPAAFTSRMAAGTQPRKISGIYGSYPPPSVVVTYTDGTSATLACEVLGQSDSSIKVFNNSYGGDGLNANAFWQFNRPTKPVQTATLNGVVVTQHWAYGSSPIIKFFVCNPPVNTQPVTGETGLASLAGPLDDGIYAVPGILGAQRYVDGTATTDFIRTTPTFNRYYESSFDPALWGGAADTSKLPHVYQNPGSNIATAVFQDNKPDVGVAVVNSNYTGDGFVALAPGLGALKMTFVDAGYANGQLAGDIGTSAADAMLYLPADKSGVVTRIFIRYYMRFGDLSLTPADRRQYYKGLDQYGNPVYDYAEFAGKLGITPCHMYALIDGAYFNSGGSGGPYGWQKRTAWSVVDEGVNGPGDKSMVLGEHLYDFKRNPPGYNYDQTTNHDDEYWGSIGGLGSNLYHNRWYLIEQEMVLNSVDVENPATPGQYWTPDGVVRTWIDGRLVYERTNFVFRTQPTHTPPYVANHLRAHRQLGVQALWMNFYHGGTNPISRTITTFITGLAYGEQRIGPMKFPTPSGPAWTSNLVDNTWVELPMERMGVWLQANMPYYGQYGPRAMNSIVNAYCDPATDVEGQAQYFYGGGHGTPGDGTCTAIIKCDMDTLEWSMAAQPTPPSVYPVNGVYPSGVTTLAPGAGGAAPYYLTVAEGLDPVIDAGKIAPALSRVVTHMYGAAVYRGGKYYCFYNGYGECDVTTGQWEPAGRFVEMIDERKLGEYTWAHYDSATDRAYVTNSTMLGAGSVTALFEFNFATRTHVSRSTPGLYQSRQTTRIAVGRKLWIFCNSTAYTAMTFDRGWIFDMDTKVFNIFSLTGSLMGTTDQEAHPGWYDGRKIRRINTGSQASKDFVYSIDPNQTPVSGAGTSASPWVFAQTATPITAPNGGKITKTYTRIHYHPEADAAMFVPCNGDLGPSGDASGLIAGGKYWALRLTD